MIETIVKIDTFEKIKEFYRLCSMCSDEVAVYSDRYVVSGKSIMGLYSLDLSEPVKVEFFGDIPKEVKESMKKFVVN